MKNFLKVLTVLSGVFLFFASPTWALVENRYCEVTLPGDENRGLAITGDLRNLVENFNRENNRSCTEEIKIGMMWGIVLESPLAFSNADDIDHDGDGFNFELMGPEGQPALIDLRNLNLDEDHPGVLVQISHSRFRHLRILVNSEDQARYAWIDHGMENAYEAVTVVGPGNIFYGHLKEGVYIPARVKVLNQGAPVPYDFKKDFPFMPPQRPFNNNF